MSSGDASLAGAEFTFRYYDGQYATAAETEASGAPTRTWAFKTNEKGRIRIMDESLKVSGDDLFYNSMGQITLPIGTLLIQETKAPEGYLIDPTVYVRNITPDGTLEDVNSYNAPTVSEQVVTGRIQIVKHTDTGTTKVETPEVGATLVVRVSGVSSRFAQVAMTVKAGSASRSIYMDDRTMAHVERLEERSDAAYRIHAVEGKAAGHRLALQQLEQQTEEKNADLRLAYEKLEALQASKADKTPQQQEEIDANLRTMAEKQGRLQNELEDMMLRKQALQAQLEQEEQLLARMQEGGDGA